MTAAVASAIEDALASFNVTITKVPLSPPDIIALIDAAARKGA